MGARTKRRPVALLRHTCMAAAARRIGLCATSAGSRSDGTGRYWRGSKAGPLMGRKWRGIAWWVTGAVATMMMMGEELGLNWARQWQSSGR